MSPMGRPGVPAGRVPSPNDIAPRTVAERLLRRRFLTLSAAAATLAFATDVPALGVAATPERSGVRFVEDPFTLGIASGDPRPDSVLLWTRLAPEPYAADGGLGAERIAVDWEVSLDERFAAVVRRGRVDAHPEYAHSVHVDVRGLLPATEYHYRFRAGDWISGTGRTRTAPWRGAGVASLTLAAVACQAYRDGWYTVHHHLARDDVDLVFHLGDYLYEHPVDRFGGARRHTDRVLPDLFARETVTLTDYRTRYALYKSDPDLKAAHAAHPFVVTWDDHETDDNYAGAVPRDDVPAEGFLARRAAAYRAYWEHQPLRADQLPQGADARMHRRLHWGTLAQFDVLDTRQYRSDQAYGDRPTRPGPESDRPARTLLGPAQERWLIDGWRDSVAKWNVTPQQVCFSARRFDLGEDARVSMDAWDGYGAARERVMGGAEAAGLENWLVLSGDVHVSYAFDIKDDFDDPGSRTVGTEVVCTSVTSGGDGTRRPGNWHTQLAANPHLRFYDGRRGYARIELDHTAARIDFRAVAAVTRRGAPPESAGTFVSEVGAPGLQPA
ncbi:alkaline phosphatase D family protein [Streptomyces sp. ZYX-F-203]